MARTRIIKPGFFINEELAELPCEARLLFIGLWTIADRAGRLEDRPRKIKAAVFPYDDCDVDMLLGLLAGKGFLNRYRVEGQGYIEIRNFIKHQKPHPKEAHSEVPGPWDGIRGSSNPEDPETGAVRSSEGGVRSSKVGTTVTMTMIEPAVGAEERAMTRQNLTVKWQERAMTRQKPAVKREERAVKRC